MSAEPDPSLRAADADRDAVADRLRTAHAEGRLTVEEFGERLDAAFGARTMGELAGLTADLPAERARVARTGDEAEASPAGVVPAAPVAHWATLRAGWGAWATAVLVTSAIWLIVSVSDGDLGYFWPIWVAGPWGAVLVARTVFGDRHRPR
jgi:Domain of unknown function (DUF1707)